MCHVSALLVTAACGDNIKPPIPGQLSEGPVIIESDPLKLIVNADGNFESDRFVELGTVAEVDETRYYDPRVIGDAVTFERIERAIAGPASRPGSRLLRVACAAAQDGCCQYGLVRNSSTLQVAGCEAASRRN